MYYSLYWFLQGFPPYFTFKESPASWPFIPWKSCQVLQGMSLEGTWLQRPGRREDGLGVSFLGLVGWFVGFCESNFPCFDPLVEFFLKKHEEEGNSNVPEKWLEKCSCFLVWLEAWQIVESYYSFCSTRLATYQPCGMSCRYLCESSMSVILCNNTQDKHIKCMPSYSGHCLKAFASDLSFCHSKIYDYPRINIWLLKLHSTDTDLPGCYVATSAIPTATQEGSKFTSRSMAWGVQFHRVRMEASTLKQPRKHLLHVEELRIYGLFMTYDSLLKQWWDSWKDRWCIF